MISTRPFQPLQFSDSVISFLPQFFGYEHLFGLQISLSVTICTFFTHVIFNVFIYSTKYSFIPPGYSTSILVLLSVLYDTLLVQYSTSTTDPSARKLILFPRHQSEHYGSNSSFYHIKRKNSEGRETDSVLDNLLNKQEYHFTAAGHISTKSLKI